MPFNRPCEKCSNKFLPQSKRAKLCPKCRMEIRKEAHKKSSETNKLKRQRYSNIYKFENIEI